MFGDVIETVLTGVASTGNVTIVNTWHYAMDPGSGPPDLAGFSTNWQAVMLSPLLAILTVDYHCLKVIHTVISGTSTGVQFIDTSIVGFAGVLAGPSEDYAYAIVVRRGDGLAQKSGRGRIFAAPVQNGVFDQSGLMVAAPTNLGTVETAMLTTCVDTTFQLYRPVLFHPPSLQTPVIVSGHSARAGIRRKRRIKL